MKTELSEKQKVRNERKRENGRKLDLVRVITGKHNPHLTDYENIKKGVLCLKQKECCS